MRHIRGTSGDRSNALWGRGSRGESRSNALWGRGGRRAGAVLATVLATLALAGTAAAGFGDHSGRGFGFRGRPGWSLPGIGAVDNLQAYVPDSLLSAIEQNPRQTFDVIVQGTPDGRADNLAQRIFAGRGRMGSDAVQGTSFRQQYRSIDGIHAHLTGRQIVFLAKLGWVSAIVPNDTVAASGYFANFNHQQWAWAVGAEVNWSWWTPGTPTIAIMDSGIDTSQGEFGNRVIGQVNMVSSSANNSPGDGYGHGTFVAGIAAGSAWGNAGVAPRANLLSVDVMDDSGTGTVSDILAACDWVLQNKAAYNIRVVNMSFHAANRASVLFDPLDQAVEKLWLNGVVVVTAAGNYGVNGQQGEVSFAPGNDPFVVTVGAADINHTLSTRDDFAAPWSAYGYTTDGFAKPDLGAPGRYMIEPVPGQSMLLRLRPANTVAAGLMQLSGTSFAAPAVAGTAAQILARHPDWTPDQVKGALMVSASPTPAAAPLSLGVGELNVPRAEAVQDPPNPNADLTPFVTVASDGTKVFDSAAWQSSALSSAAWASAAWSDAAWASAAWSSAAWASAAWASVAWASAAWGSAAWSDAAWADAAWADAAWADNANDAAVGDSTVTADPTNEDAALASLGLSCDTTLTNCVYTGTTSSG